MYALISGPQFSEQKLHGPFASVDNLILFAESLDTDTWEILPIFSPNEASTNGEFM
jgi:hypothetical protein